MLWQFQKTTLLLYLNDSSNMGIMLIEVLIFLHDKYTLFEETKVEMA